jgi:hypothetical protein
MLQMEIKGFSEDELMASAREDAFTGMIKLVSLKYHPELRDKLKPHFEAIMNEIDVVRIEEKAAATRGTGGDGGSGGVSG